MRSVVGRRNCLTRKLYDGPRRLQFVKRQPEKSFDVQDSSEIPLHQDAAGNYPNCCCQASRRCDVWPCFLELFRCCVMYRLQEGQQVGFKCS